MLKLDCCFPQPLQNFWLHASCPASIYQKILGVVFDLIYVVMNY